MVRIFNTLRSETKENSLSNELWWLGTPLFGRRIKADGEFAEIMIVRAGIFEDEELLNLRGPEAELYTERKLKWVGNVEGAAQVEGMLELS